MPKSVKEYKVYYIGGKVTRHYSDDNKPWIVCVRAKSIKQAYYVVACGIVCADMEERQGRLCPKRGAGIGIVSVNHSDGPSKLSQWPFPFHISEVGNGWGEWLT